MTPFGQIVKAPTVLGPDGKPWQSMQGYEDAFPLPHVIQFSSLVGAAWRVYYHGQHDDAVKNDPEFAIAMRRDPFLRALLQERKMATVNRSWHIEVNNPRDPRQKAMADGLKTVLDQIPRKRQMNNYLLESIWYGRYGSQLAYRDRVIRLPGIRRRDIGNRIKVQVPIPTAHQPVLGDKIGYLHDGTPYIQVHGSRIYEVPGARVIPTTQSRAIALEGPWRTRFIIHQHESLDADYFLGDQAGKIYGVGVRDVLYWFAWLKRELLASILTYAERMGMGLRVWYYQAGNDASKKEVLKAAESQSDRTNILVPRSVNNPGRPAEAVEFQETGSSMSSFLMEVFREFDSQSERFVIGQSLSSGTEGAGLGGTGVASLHANTKFNLIQYDAENLGETYTLDLVRPLAYWIYPSSLVEEANPRYAFDVAPPSPTEQLSAVNSAWAMGVSFEENSIRSITGLPAPQDGDKIVSQSALQKEQLKVQQEAQAAMQPQGGMPGMPGQPGAPGQEAEPSDEDFQAILQELGASPQQNSRRGELVRYGATTYDGPHVGPQGKTYWISKSAPSNHLYTNENPNQKVPGGTESPSDISSRITPVMPTKPPVAQGQAAPQPQQGGPNVKAIKHAAGILMHTLGDEAGPRLTALIRTLRADPAQKTKLIAAEHLRDALEHDHDDYQDFLDRAIGKEKNSRRGEPERYAAPGAPTLLDSMPEPSPAPSAPQITLPETIKRVKEVHGPSASAHVKQIADQLDIDKEKDPSLHRPASVARRVLSQLEMDSPKEKLTDARQQFLVNLSAATGNIPGLDNLHKKAERGDKAAARVLSHIAGDGLSYLIGGIPGAKIKYEPRTGLYGGSLEASAEVAADMDAADTQSFRKGVVQFGKAFKQHQVHIRGDVEAGTPVGHIYPDASFNTPSFRFSLDAPLSQKETQKLIDKFGLPGLTIGPESFEVYYAGDPKDRDALAGFEESVARLQSSLRNVRAAEASTHRLWMYGNGSGSIPYEDVEGELRPGSTKQNPSATRLAAFLARRDVKASPAAKEITPEQSRLQTKIAEEFDQLPLRGDKTDKLTATAYSRLGKEITTQFDHMPIEVELVDKNPYTSSAEMRKDILENNRLKVYATEPNSFGSGGIDYGDHPLLADSGRKDANGRPMSLNDVLRAVHDYYAHTMEPVEFGPRGEEAAWKNHMAMIQDPLARWALTTETRGQNSWVNFGPHGEHNRKNPNDTIFAPQKTGLLSPEWAMTGNEDADQELMDAAKAWGWRQSPEGKWSRIVDLTQPPPRPGTLASVRAMAAEGERAEAADQKAFFTKFFPELLARTRRLKDPNDPRAIAKASRELAVEVGEWVKDNPHYANYYRRDWATTRWNLNQHFGKQITDDEFAFYRVAAGLTSPGTKLDRNIKEAAMVFANWMGTKDLRDNFEVGVKPGKRGYSIIRTPFGFAGPTGPNKVRTLLTFDQAVREQGGVQKAIEWFSEDIPVSELNDLRKHFGYGKIGNIGSIKSTVAQATGQNPNDDIDAPRWMMFSSKIGPYVMNSIGDPRMTTVDIWESRIIRSQFKNMFGTAGLPKNASETKLFHAFISKFNKALNEVTGKEWLPSAAQAVRWFYMLETARQAGYNKASTSETISAYTQQALQQLQRDPDGIWRIPNKQAKK